MSVDLAPRPVVVRYSSNQAMFRDSPVFFAIAVLLIAAYGIGLVILGVWWIRAKHTKIEVTDQSITFEEVILSKTRTVVSRVSVRLVRVRQTLMQRITGVGGIGIVSAGDQAEIKAHGMPDINRLRDLLSPAR